ncbi:metallophosphoesterase [Paenibacillus alvei]|uniref:metallophosphoesterase n=1 Tax=Paenibacillus alvei TaxID=44250 RepID=UPI00228100A9|nr:metallophosphoesterase [Paenibacillus alvei]
MTRDTNPNSVANPGRRRLLRMMVGAVITMPMAVGGYARFIEPNNIRQRKLELDIHGLPASFNGLTIAHISDIHYGHHLSESKLASIVQDVQANQPDVICITGDIVDNGDVVPAEIVPILRQLRAPYGSYAVLGNHDYRGRGAKAVENALQTAGIRVLRNDNVILRRNHEVLALAGIDDVLEGIPDMTRAMQGISGKMCCILLAHEPDWGTVALNYQVDLQLSGHSHGGQVRVPLVGPLFLPTLGERYPDGLYMLERVDRPDRPLHIYTSRGLGTTFLPVRLLCPPEWTLLTLRSIG